MKIEVSNGEILDKYSILEIKLEKISDPDKLLNVEKELKALKPSFDKINNSEAVDQKYKKLKEINEKLWKVEDRLRELEKDKDFKVEFILRARMVYYTNDKRAKVKYAINNITGSDLVEEKSYEDYE
jgi:hypothetical protein|tara:strand:- start:11 stop:391 length:381 start_codon:yes stop_codon:yes gene_type:complete